MAKVKITGHASGSGVITVTAPNTSTDRTITLPDATATIATTADVTAATFNPNAAQVFNESGADVDFRVESDTLTHALFVQGSDGNVGVGITEPQKNLHIFKTEGDAGTKSATIRLGGYSTVGADISAYRIDGNSNNQGLIFSGYHASNGTVDALTITNDGRGLSQFTAKAWMRFDQYSSNTLRDSHNVSSVTDHSTGEFTMNFSNNMGNANYCVQGTGHYGASANDMGVIQWRGTGDLTTGSARFYFMSQINNGTSGSLHDAEEAMILIFGD